LFRYYITYSDQLFEKDRYQKISDTTLKPAVWAFCKKVSLQSSSASARIYAKILKVVSFILLAPLTLPLTLIGFVSLFKSKTYKILKTDIKAKQALARKGIFKDKNQKVFENGSFSRAQSRAEVQKYIKAVLSQPQNKDSLQTPAQLKTKVLGFIERLQAPKKSDFSSQEECEVCFETLKRCLLNPKIAHVDENEVKWRGGVIRALTGGSGGVYALGFYSEKLREFKAILVAKVLSEEPGAPFGEPFSPQLITEVSLAGQDPDLQPDYDPVRVGIAPGKGVLNEYLSSLTVFSTSAVALSRITHKDLKDTGSIQRCCLMGFVESEGSFDALSKAQGYIEQAEFALTSKDCKKTDALKKQQRMSMMLLEKATSLGIMQDSKLSSLEDKIDFTGFENVMAQDILTRNQDAQAQNLLLIKKKDDLFELKAIDYGATFSSLYMTKNEERDLPAWTSFQIAKKPVALNEEMRKKLEGLNASALIEKARSIYAQHSLNLDVGAENGIRASVALLKSALQKPGLTFERAAKLTFLQASRGYPNEITKAIKLCKQKINDEGLENDEIGAKLDEYLLDYFTAL